jgi:UDP-GlcNAc:undecaprenyl-phosphate/decaprenyl-phosphate GlcNAc-1-phosphate transferase
VTGRDAAGGVACAGIAAAVAGRLVAPAIERAPARLLRTNVSGARVPAVLGGPLAAGALCGLGAGGLVPSLSSGPTTRRVLGAGAGLIVAMGLVGYADDLLGEEPARGFAGHLAALARGRPTGGALKMAGGALAGVASGLALAQGREAVELGGLVALSANWVNLLDRAPGRALKVSLAAGSTLCLVGAPAFRAAGASLTGALVACAPADLGERAMLGDSGANAAGAVLGLGLGLSLGPRARRAAIAVLALLTAASERWSYSRLIDAVAPLRWVDRLGRPAPGTNPLPPC